MRFSSTASAVRDAFAQVRPYAPSSQALSAYSGVLLRTDATGSSFSLTGSDGDSTLTVTVPADSVEVGQALLAARPLSAYLGTLDDSTVVEFTLADGGDLSVKPEGLPGYTFRPVSTTYPAPPAPTGSSTPVDISSLAAAISAIRPAVNRDTGAVRVTSSAQTLTLHSTDGYRLARVVVPGAGFGAFSGVLSLQTLERAARVGASAVLYDSRARLLSFRTDAAVMTARPLATPFPAVETVIDAAPPAVTGLDPRSLSRALSRLSAVADQSPVRIQLDGSTMTLSASTAEIGAGSETVELAEPVPAPFEVLVRSVYLQEAIGAFDCQLVTLSYSGSVQPLFITSAGRMEVLQVVMPVRS